MIVTIDGPAGAGKSSLARELAETLRFRFLDTGAMYRAITLGVIREQIEFDDSASLITYAQTATLRWDQEKLLLNEEDVTSEIRSPIVTDAIRHIADIAEIRAALTAQQRQFAENQNIVTEGRDQGTEVFPQADCKLYLTASPLERAQRRHKQLADLGRAIPLQQILETQELRDQYDRQRPLGSLRPAEDAIVINSDGMTSEAVLQAMIQSQPINAPDGPPSS